MCLVPPSFFHLPDILSLNCASAEPDAEDTAAEKHAPEMRNSERQCVRWCLLKRARRDCGRWQKVERMGQRTTTDGGKLESARGVLERRASSYEEPREAAEKAVLAVQLTRQLKLKLMKWSGEHAYHGDDAPRRSEWRQVGREETWSVWRRGKKWDQLNGLGQCVCAWPLPSGTTGRRYVIATVTHCQRGLLPLTMAQISDMYAERNGMVLVLVVVVETVFLWRRRRHRVS